MPQRSGRMIGRFQLENVVVDFGINRAIDHVSMDIQPGQIVGLLGHNGAGKSTILNLASGAITWTSGHFRIDSEDIPPGSTPKNLAELGVAVIHQEPSLIPSLSIFANMCLGRRFSLGTRSSRKRQLAAKALHDLGVEVDIDSPVSTLTLGQRQMVDLARSTMSADIRVLLLDEPTAALGPSQTEELHGLIRKFAARGTSVLYVSHRLPDILDICERIIVLNAGRLIMDAPSEGLSLADLSNALAPGLKKETKTASASSGKAMLDVQLSQSSVKASEAEVVGLYGMASGSQFDIAAELFGLSADARDVISRITLAGSNYRVSDPRKAMKRGVFYVPMDRDVEGLIGDVAASTNILLPWYHHIGGRWHIGPNFGNDLYERCRKELSVIGPDGNTPISQFSGGNRQKHLLARWMFPAQSRLLVLSQPTQGVDIGAKQDIVRAVRNKAKQGTCIIVASSEADEIVSMCDRAYVVVGGSALQYSDSDLNEEHLLQGLLTLSQSASVQRSEEMEHQ
ncbi:ATP-binding cassette domain-containing protein [Bifidobacterium aquikefiricola]|uniref:Sugar ABC transporter ATP-binding protein n=1 Tax=Bifidobacterium aquikefiricola TaxID=3059038 RepID=A0AB39U8T1_9BIFI